jgi:ketosteroid isomerase-like protein
MTTESLAERSADVVRRGYRAFNEADLATLAEIFAKTAAWHTPGRSVLAGAHTGRDAVFAQFGRYGGETNGTFRAALQSVLATDDGLVIAIHRNTADRNGKRLDVECCLSFEIKDGKIVSGREYFSDLYAWDDFWA